MSKTACAVALLMAVSMSLGCGNTFRPVTTTLPVTTGNPAGAETEVVLNQCPTPGTCSNGNTGTASDSILTAIDVAGDFNSGNRQLQNGVASVVAGSVGGVNIPATPMAFDYSRTMVLTANRDNNTVSEQQLNTAGGGFAPGTTTLTLPTGSAPTSMSFQFFGATYTQDYVVNSGHNATCPATGSLGVIQQPGGTLKTNVCVGPTPVAAWIFHDQSKVLVLDAGTNPGSVYVVNASSYKVTHTIQVGMAPMKAAQDSTGQYVYVLNVGDGTPGTATISILDGQAEQVVQTVPVSSYGVCGTDATPSLCDSPVIDMAQDTALDDTNQNRNRLWLLHANGTVSVWDGTTPGTLSWITSVPTITTAQAAAGDYPTNLALLRDLSYAYVGIGNTDQVVAIDSSLLHHGEITPGAESTASFPATTSITVGVHRTVDETLTNNINATSPVSDTVRVEETTPVVTSVGVSRAFAEGTGNSVTLFKAYATTVTSTKYYCYDENVQPTDCANSDPWVNGTPITELPPATPFLVSGCTNLNVPVEQNAMSCPDLYNGTSVVSAASGGTYPVNTLITDIGAPAQVLYCNPSSGYDGQKYCPAMQPLMVIGRN
jgi:hypothetical protein